MLNVAISSPIQAKPLGSGMGNHGIGGLGKRHDATETGLVHASPGSLPRGSGGGREAVPLAHDALEAPSIAMHSFLTCVAKTMFPGRRAHF